MLWVEVFRHGSEIVLSRFFTPTHRFLVCSWEAQIWTQGSLTSEGKRPHSKCLCNSATKELRCCRYFNWCMDRWCSCTSRSWSVPALRSLRAISEEDPQLHKISFPASLSSPNAIGCPNEKKNRFAVTMKNVYFLYIWVGAWESGLLQLQISSCS